MHTGCKGPCSPATTVQSFANFLKALAQDCNDCDPATALLKLPRLPEPCMFLSTHRVLAQEIQWQRAAADHGLLRSGRCPAYGQQSLRLREQITCTGSCRGPRSDGSFAKHPSYPLRELLPVLAGTAYQTHKDVRALVHSYAGVRMHAASSGSIELAGQSSPVGAAHDQTRLCRKTYIGEEGEEVTSRRTIVSAYLHGMLLTDMLALAPLDYVVLLSSISPQSPFIKVCKAMR